MDVWVQVPPRAQRRPRRFALSFVPRLGHIGPVTCRAITGGWAVADSLLLARYARMVIADGKLNELLRFGVADVGQNL